MAFNLNHPISQNDLIDIAPIWRDHRGYTNELQVPFNHNAPKFTKLEIELILI